MSIERARQLHTGLRGYIEAEPDRRDHSGKAIDIDEKIDEIDRLIHVLTEVAARQLVIIDELIKAAEQT